MSDWQSALWLVGLVAVVVVLDGGVVLLNRAAERQLAASHQQNVGTRLSPSNGVDTRAALSAAARTGVEGAAITAETLGVQVGNNGSLDPAQVRTANGTRRSDWAGASPAEYPAPALPSAGATPSPRCDDAPAEAHSGGSA
jgi:hypothetical protein